MNEQSLCTIRASVMMYDSKARRWFPCGGNGLSRINILATPNMMANQFRIVGRKNDTNDVSLNCPIKKSLIYNEATPTFHQWRFEGEVYGLNFPNQEEAVNFAKFMKKALDDVNGRLAFQFFDPEDNNNDVGLFDMKRKTSSNNSHRGSEKNFDRIQIGDRNYASEQQKRPTPPSNETKPVDFSDELKRRLANRQGPPQPPTQHVEERPTPTQVVKPHITEDPVRLMIRDELQIMKRDLLTRAREMIRTEMRSMSYDSHI